MTVNETNGKWMEGSQFDLNSASRVYLLKTVTSSANLQTLYTSGILVQLSLRII